MAYIRKITRKKGVVYRAEIALTDGSKKSHSFRTMEEARRWSRGEEDSRQSQKDYGIIQVRMTLDEYFEKWMECSDRQMHIKYISPLLGQWLIKEIQPPDIQRVLNAMVSKGLAKSYANRVRQMLHKIFNEAVKTDRYLIFNPVSAVKPYKEIEKPISTLNRDEAFQLLRWADQQELGLGIHLALGLGLREGEVSGLMWDAVDLGEQRSLAVRRKYQKKISVLEEFTKGKKMPFLRD
jgi:integrase